MPNPYLCPNCKTNRTRFNLIEQNARAIKKHPQTGEVTEEWIGENLEPMHLSYQGPNIRVQCATCGVIEDEISFVKRAEYSKKSL
ncbi:DNA alkylation repair protein [Pontibacillus litoralis]|uniref:DNA alkylation repair protein n=1 Tax=Pontibacillus litoralis JSM 072002 TaxID=1385512 RepID=A0A0A5HTW7_9BACI|nr:DNA alkylation repair protein [Pontibacillus litoralis]KGX87052.1 DNA alkylation repair protein [Pontibacillus litoralis JSM 072002]